jgi:hypothetical protein
VAPAGDRSIAMTCDCLEPDFPCSGLGSFWLSCAAFAAVVAEVDVAVRFLTDFDIKILHSVGGGSAAAPPKMPDGPDTRARTRVREKSLENFLPRTQSFAGYIEWSSATAIAALLATPEASLTTSIFRERSQAALRGPLGDSQARSSSRQPCRAPPSRPPEAVPLCAQVRRDWQDRRDLLLASSWRDPRIERSTCLVQKTAPQYSSGNASGDLTLALGHHPVLNTKASAAVAIGPASDVAGGEDVGHAGGEISSTIDRRCRQGPVQTRARPRCQPPRVRHRVE